MSLLKNIISVWSIWSTTSLCQLTKFSSLHLLCISCFSWYLQPAGNCVRSILSPPCYSCWLLPRTILSLLLVLLLLLQLLFLRTILVKQLRLQILPGWNALMKPTCDVIATCHGRVMLTTEKVCITQLYVRWNYLDQNYECFTVVFLEGHGGRWDLNLKTLSSEVNNALKGGAQARSLWSIASTIGQCPSSPLAAGVNIQVNICQ